MRNIAIMAVCALVMAGCSRNEQATESLTPEEETVRVRMNTLTQYESLLTALDESVAYITDFDSVSHPDDLRWGDRLCTLRTETHQQANEIRRMLDRPQQPANEMTQGFCDDVAAGIERNA